MRGWSHAKVYTLFPSGPVAGGGQEHGGPFSPEPPSRRETRIRSGKEGPLTTAREASTAVPVSGGSPPAETAVLHLLAPASYGGLERVVLLLASGLAGRGGRVAAGLVLDRGMPEPRLASELEAAGVEVHRLVGTARGYLAQRRAVAGLLSTWRPGVVHTHGYHADVLFRSTAHRAGCAAVSTAHGFTGGGIKNRLFEAMNRRAWRRFDAVVAVSAPLADRIVQSGVDPARVCTIPNAWAAGAPPLPRDTAREAFGLDPGQAVVGWVGRLSHEKGPDLALEALAMLPAPRPTLVMVGSGPMADRLRDAAQRLGIADRVHWAGARAEAAHLFPAFDLFLLSSRTEGTPMVLFEAMGSGVPIVAAAVGGVPDVVGPVEAHLASPEPGALAAAISRVFTDPRGAAERVAAARRRLDAQFAVGPWAERYAAVYQSAARRRLPAGAR